MSQRERFGFKHQSFEPYQDAGSKLKAANNETYMSIVAFPAPMAAVSKYLWGAKACKKFG